MFLISHIRDRRGEGARIKDEHYLKDMSYMHDDLISLALMSDKQNIVKRLMFFGLRHGRYLGLLSPFAGGKVEGKSARWEGRQRQD